MELQYSLDSPLIGEERNYRNKEKIALILESHGKCAKCGKPYNCLDGDDGGLSINTERSNLEIAHIYALKNFKNMPHKGKKFHIKNINQINSYDNLLLLCSEHHKEYDANPKYEDYVKMVELKKSLSTDWKNGEYIYNSLYFCLDEIIKVCKDIDNVITFDYDLTHFSEKLKINKIDKINERHYKSYLLGYAMHIDNFFRDCDDDTGINLVVCFSKIYNQIKTYEPDKNIILNSISKSDILSPLSKKMNEKIFDALLSYMIWKCEVLEKYDSTKQSN